MGACDCVGELSEMLIKVLCCFNEAAFYQIAKMKRAFLSCSKMIGGQSKSAPADNPRFDEAT